MAEPTILTICYTRCEPCMFGMHFDPPQVHDWAGEDDVAHAKATGQPDVTGKPCACPCARPEPAS